MATTIKVDRLVLLQALNGKLAEQEKLRAEYKKAEEKYQKDQQKVADKVLSLAKAGKLEIHNTSYRSWNGIYEIEFKVDKALLPAEPERPQTPDGYLRDDDYEELRKTIKLLGMTAQPDVPASLYKSVAQWL